jgi:hypothetical protein
MVLFEHCSIAAICPIGCRTDQRMIRLTARSPSYKRDGLAFTNVNRSMAIHSNPGIHCNKERQMSARKNPRADLSDP